MSAKERADLIKKLHKFAKKEFEFVKPPSNRLVIEHMLYGCCLENTALDAADDAFAKLQESFYDWNEVRVTTAAELAEVMKSVSNPEQQAISIKKTLHGIFESYYQFDLEFLRKENLSKSVATFEKFKGVPPFVVSYVAQHGLNGHSIPLDRAMMLLFYTLGIATEAEATQGRVPGLERTIPKAKGPEFSSVVHQLAVQFYASPFSKKTRDQLLKINKNAKELFPKRESKKNVAGESQAARIGSEKAEGKLEPSSKSKVTSSAAVKKTAAKATAADRTTKASPQKAVAKSTTKKATANKKTPIRKKLPAKSRGGKPMVARQLANRKPK